MKKSPTDTLCDWVEAIVTRGVNLTTWEIEFIESMQIKIDLMGSMVVFTDNMAERIEEIYSARVP